jgi:hypothetical protein
MQYLLLLCLPGQITAPKDFLDSATKLNPELMGVGDIQAEPADATNPLMYVLCLKVTKPHQNK